MRRIINIFLFIILVFKIIWCVRFFIICQWEYRGIFLNGSYLFKRIIFLLQDNEAIIVTVSGCIIWTTDIFEAVLEYIFFLQGLRGIIIRIILYELSIILVV